MRKITGIMVAGVSFGGAVAMFGVAVVDAMFVAAAPQIVETAEIPMDAPAVASPGSPADEARDLQSVAVGPVTPGLEAWAAQTTSPRLPRVELERAVSQDPFQPDRRAPAQRYVLPGQRSVFAEVETEAAPAPSFRVVGSARIGRGGLALVQVDDGDMPVAVSVGESIEGYRLVSVTDEGATLTADGDSWVLSVVEPAEERRSNNNRGNNNNNNNNNRSNNNRGGNNNDQAVERAVQERVQQMIQQGLQIFGRAGGRGGGAAVVGRGGRGGGPQ